MYKLKTSIFYEKDPFSMKYLKTMTINIFLISSFASNYKNRVWRNEVMMRKQERNELEKTTGGLGLPMVNNRIKPG